MGIQDVVVPRAVRANEEALVDAAGHDSGSAGQCCHADVGTAVIKRILYADAPLRTIGFLAKDLDIATKIDDGRLDVLLFQDACHFVRGIALGYRAQVEPHARRAAGISCRRYRRS